MNPELPLMANARPGLLTDLEAILFAAGGPVSSRRAAEVLQLAEAEVENALGVLATRSVGRGVEVVAVAGGWLMRSAPAAAGAVAKWRDVAPIRPSRAALEVLAAVAWRQPITRAEIDALRGVDSAGPLRWLLGHGLVRAVGRRAEIGRPATYGTTDGFLTLLQLPDLGALPSIGEVG